MLSLACIRVIWICSRFPIHSSASVSALARLFTSLQGFPASISTALTWPTRAACKQDGGHRRPAHPGLLAAPGAGERGRGQGRGSCRRCRMPLDLAHLSSQTWPASLQRARPAGHHCGAGGGKFAATASAGLQSACVRQVPACSRCLFPSRLRAAGLRYHCVSGAGGWLPPGSSCYAACARCRHCCCPLVLAAPPPRDRAACLPRLRLPLCCHCLLARLCLQLCRHCRVLGLVAC